MADAEGGIHVIAGCRAGGLEPLRDGLEALDLEADVVDAAPALAPLDAGDGIVLEIQDRQVDIAVAQVVASRPRTVDPGDLLHAEHVDVELGGLVDVLGRKGDVLDLGHGRGASCASGSLVPARARYASVAPKSR